ncbi:MAG TPA: HigA family addiction module antitoxin [Terriglobales bacterium]|nr:HigA family addiction module antitoxin [Terriglobales bacterium]
MLLTKRKPESVGDILTEEFMEPMGLTQAALAQAMGVQRKHVNELCNNRRAVTAATALILARVFGNSAEFWLNLQRRNDLWAAMHSPREQRRVRRARRLSPGARRGASLPAAREGSAEGRRCRLRASAEALRTRATRG